jgi:uncharacterized protein (DUF342 family)
MSAVITEQSIQVRIAEDCLSAEIVVPSGFSAVLLNESVCVEAIRQAGVRVNESVVDAVTVLLKQESSNVEELRAVIAKGAPPVHGQDGQIEWLVQRQWDPNDNRSHYERSAFVMVKSGQVLGRMTDPTPGQDGWDVLEGVLQARPGKAVEIKFDESLIKDRAGQILAQADGVFERTPDQARIRRVLEVPNYVDFSTGNIDFAGDVWIRRGVRDCFTVKAKGNVRVDGVIEAATIQCGGDLNVVGGMAGRESGHVQATGRVDARYLNNVVGEIGGDLMVERELINCDLTIHGSILSDTARGVGGRMVVVGKVKVGSIGSGASVPTEIIIGTVPKYEPTAARLATLIEHLTAKRDALAAEMEQITKNTRRLTAQDRERQTEIAFELQNIGGKLVEGLMAQEALSRRIERCRTFEVCVSHRLHVGVVITSNKRSYKIRNELRGPLRLIRDDSDNLVVSENNGQSIPLSQVSEVRILQA